MDTEYDLQNKTYTTIKKTVIKKHKVDFYDFDGGFDVKNNDNDGLTCYNDNKFRHHEIIHEVKHVPNNVLECLEEHATIIQRSKGIPKEDSVEETTTKTCCKDIQTKEHTSITKVIPTVEQVPSGNGTKNQNEPTRMDWSEYHRLNVIHTFLEELEFDYPSICTVGIIGTSLEHRNLKILKISNSHASNQAVWMDAGIHAREWIAPAVATYIADHIARNFETLPTSITNKDWYFHPVVNPDGYEYSHTSDRMWRKNRARHGGLCVGVDLNRNFSYGWGGKGSSGNPMNAFYRGPAPFSEPESSAIRDFLLNSGIQFKVYITLHSYGQVILFPFAYRDELCPDYVRLLQGATIMSKAIHECNGNTYKVGISRDVMYGAAGTSNDFSYGEARIPYCYLIELRSKKHKFMLPKDEIEETGNEILNCVKALMEFVDDNSGTDKK